MNSNLQSWLDEAAPKELQEIHKYVEERITAAHEARFMELTTQFLETIQAIKTEFPYAEILISHEDEDVNILDYSLSESDFVM